VTYVAGLVETFVTERTDESGVRRPVTADDFTSSVWRMASGAVATMTLSTVAQHGPGHLGQVTGSEGTLLLTGETKLELGKAGGPLEDVSAPDDLWEKTKPNNMWARSFVRLLRDMVRVIGRRGARRRTARSATAGRCSACSMPSAAGGACG